MRILLAAVLVIGMPSRFQILAILFVFLNVLLIKLFDAIEAAKENRHLSDIEEAAGRLDVFRSKE